MPLARARRRLRRRAATPTPREHHRVYVVLLKNPAGDGRDGYYVGMTGLTPEARFANHKRGYKSARVVTRCGVGLAYEWFEDIPAMPYGEAALTEPALADELRDRGFLVFGPTNRNVPSRRRPTRLRTGRGA